MNGLPSMDEIRKTWQEPITTVVVSATIHTGCSKCFGTGSVDVVVPWRNDKPPNETWVQVMDGENVIEAMAFFGRDGYRPHWRLRDESCCPPSRFSRWREITSA